jgi:outer membrane biosynthesis protein TonB
MLAKLVIDPEGRITHLRVLRLAHPSASNAREINEKAVDSIKQWHYAPTKVDGKPVAVCTEVSVIMHLQ